MSTSMFLSTVPSPHRPSIPSSDLSTLLTHPSSRLTLASVNQQVREPFLCSTTHRFTHDPSPPSECGTDGTGGTGGAGETPYTFVFGTATNRADASDVRADDNTNKHLTGLSAQIAERLCTNADLPVGKDTGEEGSVRGQARMDKKGSVRW